MSFVKGLKCKECGREYEARAIHVCEFCFGPLEVAYDLDGLRERVTREMISRGPTTLWRYKDLLPIEGDSVVDSHAGFTPLIRAKNLGCELGLNNLYIKNDTVNPTFSFKDRVVSVAITKALELGFDTIACASTGNLAGAVAAHAAIARMKAYVFIPASLEKGKILGAHIYGPKLIAVDGSYDDVNRLCNEIADNYNWAFVNINLRPYYSEGSKTLGFEVVEQLGWRAPDHAIVPVASGSLLTKIYKGMKELYEIGLIDEFKTRISAADCAGCSPIADAFKAGSDTIVPVKPNTIAKSLAIGNPADGYYVLKIVRETGGWAEVASNEEIIDGVKLLARTEGIFAEMAGGVVIANLKKMVDRGKIKRDDVTVAFITGNGLKTQDAVEETIPAPPVIPPRMSDFERLLSN
ncbi:MAG: threonine synthase [bacterium]